jgi:inner membrane protein
MTIMASCESLCRPKREIEIVYKIEGERTPASKLFLTILVGLVLTIPLFSVWLLVYDRQSQSEEASRSITEGWGGPQTMAGPLLVIPYYTDETETVVVNGQSVVRTKQARHELTLAPEQVDLSTDVRPEVRKRSIYEGVVYDARVHGRARFVLPPDSGIDPSDQNQARGELRFGLSDPRGLGANPQVSANGRALQLEPGGGSGSADGRGFFTWLDVRDLGSQPLIVDFAYDFRGNATLALAPHAGDTRWTVRSSWPHPSFGGGFLPIERKIGDQGFAATYRVGNLALGRSLAGSDSESNIIQRISSPSPDARESGTNEGPLLTAQISLMQPVDLYSQVDRATKYGFLFIGFTFLALLMFDVIGGVRVSAVEYLLMGAALILFFVLLLAFAEIIGFTPAYILASAAIAGLNTAYSAAVLSSWRRAAFIGGLLIGLYAILYILLSLEAFSLLIGSLLLFAALAGVMYATRRIDWGAKARAEAA